MRRTIKSVVAAFVLLGFAAPSAWAYRLPANSDNDALADEVEQWLLDNNVANDDAGQAISPTATNVYNDDDNDSIPDIIELHVSGTSNSENDLIAKTCPGDGTFNYSGQRGFRVFTEGGAGTQNLKLQYLSHLNFCHLGNDQILVYQPNLGYNDRAASSLAPHPTLADTYALHVVWTNNGQTVAILTANLTGPIPVFTANISGTFTIVDGLGGSTNIPFGSSGHIGTLALQNIDGVVGLQSKLIDVSNSLVTTIPGVRNPGSRTAYIAVNPGGLGASASVVFYVENNDLMPGYYIPSVGGLFILSSRIQPDQTHKIVTIKSIFLRDRNGSNGAPNSSDFRGQIDIRHTNSSANVTIDEQHENFYARHGEVGQGAPELQAHTIVRPTRTFTRLNFYNVPFVADQLTLTGPGNLNHTYVDVNDSGNDYLTRLRLRNIVPGFVDNPAVGVSGSDGSRGPMYISQLNYQTAAQDTLQILPSGTYTVNQSVTGNPEASATYTANYTPSTQSLSVVTNVTFNNFAWQQGIAINNVGVARDQTISYSHTDAANTQRYLLILQRSDGEYLNNFGATRLFFKSNTNNITIPQGALDPSASYCGRIQAKHNVDGNLRSETELLCFNTVSGSGAGDGSIWSPPITFSGMWTFKETIASVNGVCATDIGSTTQYPVDVSQNGNSFTADYNGTILSGSINGSQITLNGNVPSDGGTNTFNLKGTLNEGCLIATSNWTWSNGVDNCTAGISDVTATLTTNPNACDSVTNPGNPPSTPSGGGGGGGSTSWLWLLLLPIGLIARRFFGRRVEI